MPPDAIRAFEIASSWADEPLSVDLPTAWAADVEHLRVALDHHELFGWQANLVSGDVLVLSFGWHDHVDQMLLSDSVELPTTAPADEWDDLEQGWWASIHRCGDHLFVADGDFDELIERMPATPVLTAPGRVDVGGTEVLWHRVRVDAYEAAWAAAKQFFRDRI